MARIDPEQFAIGLEIGDRLNQGLAEWRKIQQERQDKAQAKMVIDVLEKSRQQRRARNAPQGLDQLKTMEQVLKRNPGVQPQESPNGIVGRDGQPEVERYVDTPEGVISINQYEVLQGRARQAMTDTLIEDLDDAYGYLAQFPNNPAVRKYVESITAGATQQLNAYAKQLEQQRLVVDQYEAEQNARNQSRTRDLEEQKYREEPERYKGKVATDTRADITEKREQQRLDIERDREQSLLRKEEEAAKPRAEKAPTEFVLKLRQMAPRAAEALKELDSLTYDRTGVTAGVSSLLPNAVRSEDRQRFDQAKLQFANSILRAESGATITETELEKAMQQYFPVLGESKEVVEQKRRARETAVRGLYDAAGLGDPEFSGSKAGRGPSALQISAPPEIQDILNRYPQ